MPEEVLIESMEVRDERRVSFFIIDNVVLDESNLSPGAFWLYSKLVRYAQGKADCFPSLNTLAKAGDCSRGTIVNWRKELVDAKLINFETRETEKSGHCNTKYTLRDVAKKKTPCQSTDKPPLVNLTSPPLSATEHVIIYKKEKEEEIIPPVPPSPGAGSLPNYRFKDFWGALPDRYKSPKQEKECRAIWDSRQFDQQTAADVVQWTAAMSQSAEWIREDGKYSYAGKTILESEKWKQPLTVSAKYWRQCRDVWDYFIEVTGQAKSTSKLTPDRLDMIAHRIEEAHQMKSDIDPDGERSLMMDAIDAAHESPYYKKHPEALTIESVYGSAEKFEKLVKREVMA